MVYLKRNILTGKTISPLLHTTSFCLRTIVAQNQFNTKKYNNIFENSFRSVDMKIRCILKITKSELANYKNNDRTNLNIHGQ